MRVFYRQWLPFWKPRYAVGGRSEYQTYWTKGAALRALPLMQRGPYQVSPLPSISDDDPHTPQVAT